MAQTGEIIRNRITSLLCTSPFTFSAPDVETLADVPVDRMDRAVLVTLQPGATEGLSDYIELRFDRMLITVARLHQGSPRDCYEALIKDVASISAAVVRDGSTGGGDYGVGDDGRGVTIGHDPGASYSTAAIVLPLDYEAQL